MKLKAAITAPSVLRFFSMRKIEFLIAVLYTIALMMIYAEKPGARVLLLFATAIIALFYLITGVGLSRRNLIFYAWRFTPREERPALIMRTLSGVAFAYSIVTVTLNLLFIRHFETHTIIAIGLLTVVMFFSMRLLENENAALNRAILLRAALLSMALTFYAATPLHQRIAWQFEDVYYRELLQFSIANPDDEEAQRDLRDYEQRMRGVTLPNN
jgi:hypothetical protein